MKSNILLTIIIVAFFRKSLQQSLSFNKDDEATTIRKLEKFFDEKCECIKIMSCDKMTDIISRVKLPIPSKINEKIRQTSCGFKDNEPLICCPYKSNLYKVEPIDVASFRLGSSDNDDDIENFNSDWVWPKDDFQFNNLHQNNVLDDQYKFQNSKYKNKFPFHNGGNSYYNKNVINMENLIDFEDKKTHKNCPPSFFNDDFNTFYEKSKFSNKNNNYPEKYYRPEGIHSDFSPYKNPYHYHGNHNGYEHLSPNNYWNNHFHGHRHRFNTNDFPSRRFPEYQPTTKSPSSSQFIPSTPSTFQTVPERNLNNNFNMNNVGDRNVGNENKINSEQCGVSIGTRIIGGTASVPGQFPWMARIAYRNITSGRISYRCAGSFINQLYIVTAAHCITNLIDNLIVSHIKLGDDTDENSSLLEYQIERLLPHPNYDSPKYANDIALIKISPPQNLVQITPVCLPAGLYKTADNDIVGKNGTVAGWLSNSRGAPRSNNLEMNWIQLPIVNQINCAKIYADFSINFRAPIIVSDSQICAQGTENMDACQGDSGGPLMLENTDRSNPKLVLLGLVSFGPRSCGISNFPGVYTRISSYIDWINNNITL